jgi:mannitol-1-/sugar-/sorbitol-6-/2-deoxyglucose-6-phosphatase
MEALIGNITKNKAVIFDMDGVIIDSEKLWSQAENEVFTSLGVKVTDKDSQLTKTMTTSEVTKFWYEKFPWHVKSLYDVEQMVISRVIEMIEREDYNIPGIKTFIENLKAKKCKIGLATNSPERIIPVVLQKAGIAHLFDVISSAEFEERGKPHPAIYKNIAKKLNVEPCECIVFEDSYTGMLAAKDAGMTVVAFTNGNLEADFEIADFNIHSF